MVRRQDIRDEEVRAREDARDSEVRKREDDRDTAARDRHREQMDLMREQHTELMDHTRKQGRSELIMFGVVIALATLAAGILDGLVSRGVDILPF
jgi:hypothetical protein